MELSKENDNKRTIRNCLTLQQQNVPSSCLQNKHKYTHAHAHKWNYNDNDTDNKTK